MKKKTLQSQRKKNVLYFLVTFISPRKGRVVIPSVPPGGQTPSVPPVEKDKNMIIASITIYLFTILFVGITPDIPDNYQDSEFYVYTKQFIRDAKYYTKKDYTERVDSLGILLTKNLPGVAINTAVGVCWYRSKKIFILKDYWYALSNFEKKILLYHELGHCVLGKDHTERKFKNGCTPIMYPKKTKMEGQCFKNHRHIILTDFFKEIN